MSTIDNSNFLSEYTSLDLTLKKLEKLDPKETNDIPFKKSKKIKIL